MNSSTPSVRNLKSPRSGSPVANQYEIIDGNFATFQSYETVIAKKVGYNYTFSGDYNYSVTTGKYLNVWLREYGWIDSEIKSLKKWLAQAKEGDTTSLIIDNVTVNYVEEF